MGLRRRRTPEAEPDPPLAVAAPAVADPEIGHFRHPTYSIPGAMKYILLLSVLLWWLPTVGQMIAGYVGGRRAGGPWRGVLAAVVPVLIIVVLAWGLDSGLLAPWLGGVAAIPAVVGGAVSGWFPPAAPFVTFVLAYLAAFVEALRATLSMGTNGYLVTIVFAYIGGILAAQVRREVRSTQGTAVGISITQPLLHPFQDPYPVWEARRASRFEDLHKIPVAGARVDRTRASRPSRPHKVQAKAADSGDEEAVRARGDASARPEQKALSAHDKEVATRRFVERALRQYEAAHRR